MEDNANVSAALELRSWGLNVIPAPYRKKKPAMKWERWQHELPPEGTVSHWFTLKANYWVACGKVSGVVVLDIDNADADTFWREKLPDFPFDTTPHVLTSKGRHYYFAWREGAANWSSRKEVADGTVPMFEVRSDGGGVIAPPSRHDTTEHVYSWGVRPGEGSQAGTGALWPALPDALLDAVHAGIRAPSPTGGASGGGPGQRSLLGDLLRVKSSAPERGNNWFTQVCGHFAAVLAAAEKPYDFYHDIVTALDDQSETPQTEEQRDKTARSVWLAEIRQRESAALEAPPLATASDGGASGGGSVAGAVAGAVADASGSGDGSGGVARARVPTESSGWLTGDGRQILAPTQRVTGAGQRVNGFGQWADCDVRALGVTVGSSDEERIFDVEITLYNGKKIRDRLTTDLFADGKRLRSWFGRHGAGIHPPSDITKRADSLPFGEAFRLYLESQKPSEFEITPSLGWYGDDFICYEGIISTTSTDIVEHRTSRPRLPARGEQRRYRYSAGRLDEARGVLREVLTFHDEQIAAVFGAWWAASLVRPRLADVSHFPIMGIEAPSGAGKTTGMFALMVSLSGNVQGPTVPTVPALRDELRINNAGLVWVDDATRPDLYQEIVRAVASSSTLAKKGLDRSTTEDAILRGSLILSGETLALGGQQAMLERVILLEPPDPKDRRSLKDAGRNQWLDVKDLMRRYPDASKPAIADLTVFAGDVVRLAGLAFDSLRNDTGFNALRGELSGRTGDKVALLRLGARLLSHMTEDPAWTARVDLWAAMRDTTSDGQNRLVLELLPRMLAETRYPSALGLDRLGQIHPVVQRTMKVSDPHPTVLFNIDQMVAYMGRHRWAEGRIDDKSSLDAQRKRLGITDLNEHRARLSYKSETGEERYRYWKCPLKVSRLILDKAGADFEIRENVLPEM